MQQAKDFSDNGYTQDCDIWSDECTAQMFGDGKAMCYFGPAWYFNFSMGNAQDADKGCFGDWAICEGPQAHFWGGTWLLAPAGTDNPNMVADIMNTFINDEEVCTNLVKNEAQFSNNQKVNETVAQDPTYGSEFLGGQNDIALFCDLAKNIKFENHTIYDQLLNEGLQANWREYCKGTVTEDEAMSSEDTVEIDAATGPTIATPASHGGRVSTMVRGIILSTLPPYEAKSPVSTPAESTPSVVTPIIMAPIIMVPPIIAPRRLFVSL